MKNALFILATSVALSLAASAQADVCFADYKAKRDSPLRLHYGVIQLSGGCTKKAARQEIRSRISTDGWVLLNVLSVFDSSGLAQRQDSAGNFHLRY